MTMTSTTWLEEAYIAWNADNDQRCIAAALMSIATMLQEVKTHPMIGGFTSGTTR